MQFFQKSLLVLSFIITYQAKAFTPESGFWWNPDESGSGYSIEIQDNLLFVALYVYDEFGNPTWYSAVANLSGNALFNADIDYTYNGTCIDCSYTAPITLFGDQGPMTINFLTETTATIQFQGAIKGIERFNFALGDEAERMLGEWQAVIDFSSTGVNFPFNGDVLLFESTSFTDGDKYADGCRPDNTIDGFCSDFALNNHEMAAVFDYLNNQMLVVVDDSPDFWLSYTLDLGLNQFDGVAELYPKSTGNNNIFYPVRGFKSASRSFVQTGVGPSKKASFDNKENVGIGDMLKIRPVKKPLSEFSKEEQAKILRQRTIMKTLINRLENN